MTRIIHEAARPSEWTPSESEVKRSGFGSSEAVRSNHLHERVVQNAVAEAARLAVLTKPATPHTLLHSFATDLVRDMYHPCLEPRADAGSGALVDQPL